MAVADRHGLPIAVGIASGQRHETKLVVDTLRARFLKQLPERLIGDRAYDSNGLDDELRAMGIEMIAPHTLARRTPLRLVSKCATARHALRAQGAELLRLHQAPLHRDSRAEVVK
jgi:hypothetical protein